MLQKYPKTSDWGKDLESEIETKWLQKIISDADFNSNSIGKFSMHKIINEKAPESAFLCMIMPLESSTVFVKLKSTMNGVGELKKEFYRFCSSFRYLK